jgi:hypothetical protein
MHSRQAINTGAGLEGLTTLQPHSWHPLKPTRRVKGCGSIKPWSGMLVRCCAKGLRTEDWHELMTSGIPIAYSRRLRRWNEARRWADRRWNIMLGHRNAPKEYKSVLKVCKQGQTNMCKHPAEPDTPLGTWYMQWMRQKVKQRPANAISSTHTQGRHHDSCKGPRFPPLQPSHQ